MQWRPFRSSMFWMTLAASAIPSILEGMANGQEPGYENPMRIAQTPQSPYNFGAGAGTAAEPGEAPAMPGGGSGACSHRAVTIGGRVDSREFRHGRPFVHPRSIGGLGRIDACRCR